MCTKLLLMRDFGFTGLWVCLKMFSCMRVGFVFDVLDLLCSASYLSLSC